MKKIILSSFLSFGSVMVSLGGYITGSTQVCPNVTTGYSVNFQSGGTCEIITWVVKDANGNDVPWQYNSGREYQINVVWPATNGIGSVKAIGKWCCRIQPLCFRDKVESINVKIGPDNVTGISGPITMCNGSTSFFSATAVANATSYTWVVGRDSFINGQPGTLTTTSNSVNIQMGATSSTGLVRVTANACNGTVSSAPYSKYINLGVFSDFSISGPSCSTNYNYLSFYPFVPGSYEWIVRLGNEPPVTYYSSSVSLSTSSPTRVDAQLRINTGCGWSDWKSFFAYPCSGGGGGFELLEVYPNSASNEVTVEVPNDLNINLVSLRNSEGDLVNTIRIAENLKSFKIDVSKYNDGTYFLNFETKDGVITKRLLVKK